MPALTNMLKGVHAFVEKHPVYSRIIATSPLWSRPIIGPGYGKDLEAMGEGISDKTRERIDKGLEFAQELAPRIGESTLYGTLDPIQSWVGRNKTTALALAGSALLPMGVFAMMAIMDKRRLKENALNKTAGLGGVAKGVGTVAGTALAALPPWLYFAPSNWPGSKDKLLAAGWDRVAGDTTEGWMKGLMGAGEKSLARQLVPLGEQAGKSAGKALLSPTGLALGVGGPVAVYLAWKLSNQGELRRKREAADALAKARGMLDASMTKSAANLSWLKWLPTYVGLGGAGAIGASVWAGGAGRRLKSGSGAIGERVANTMEKVLSQVNPTAFEESSRLGTEAFLKELDKRKWPLLGSMAGGAALLAGAKYLMDRREREADAEIEANTEYINNLDKKK